MDIDAKVEKLFNLLDVNKSGSLVKIKSSLLSLHA